MGYTYKAMTGFGYLGLLRGLTKGMGIVKIVILSRILSPNNFGVFGITIAILALVEKITETGINTFLIQKDDGLTKYLNSAWVIAIIRGGVISIFIFISSFILPGFYKDTSLTQFLLLACTIPLIKGFINPAEITFWKHMQYSLEVRFRGFFSVLEAVLSVVFVLLLHSPLGLMYALIVSAIAEAVLSHVLIQPRPKFRADKTIISEILHASKYLNLSVVFSFLVTNVDNLIIGKILGITQLGYYQNGYNVASSSTGDIGDLTAQTIFPIYTAIHNDRRRLRIAFLKSAFVLAVLSAVPPLIVMANPTWIVSLVLGEKWLPIVPFLPFLFIAMYLRSINGAMHPLFLAINRAKWNVMILIVQIIALVLLIIPLSRSSGLVGASIAVMFSYLLIQPIFFFFVRKAILTRL